MKKALGMLLALCMLLALAPAAFADAEIEAADMFGTKEGNVYTNKALGIRAEFPDDWVILSDQEYQELLGLGLDAMGNVKLAEMLESNTAVMDLYAIAFESGESVNIMLQKLTALQSMLLTEEKIAEINVDTLEEQLKDTGIEVTELAQTTVPFAGKDHAALQATCSVQGAPMCNEIVFLKVDTYYAAVTFTTHDQERAAAILDVFQAIEAE